jgi:hypothetical protein
MAFTWKYIPSKNAEIGTIIFAATGLREKFRIEFLTAVGKRLILFLQSLNIFFFRLV